jgi:hypothetical protein
MMAFGAALSPALLALFIQVLALFLLILLTFFGLWFEQHVLAQSVVIKLSNLVVPQSLIAVGLAILFGAPIWWCVIHFTFPVAVYAAYQLGVPSEWYLGAFLFSLGVFWSVFKTQVPYFPSTRWVWNELVELIPPDSPKHVIDIGSGLGRLPIYIAKERPLSLVEGIEVAPLLWGVSCLLAFFRGSKAIFKLGNYHDLNFKHYDLVFAYLSPAAMPALWEKATAEMRDGALLLSYEFEIPGMHPSLTISEGDGTPLLYVWKMKKSADSA